GFAPNHVLVLTDQDATTNNIMRVMTKLLPNAVQPDDLVLLYFSCHGSGREDQSDFDNNIITYDWDGQANKGIHMQTLGDLIKNNVRSNRVVTVLDLCFSGNARDLDSRDYLDSMLMGSGQIIVSSCGPNETAMENEKLGHGVFTYEMI